MPSFLLWLAPLGKKLKNTVCVKNDDIVCRSLLKPMGAGDVFISGALKLLSGGCRGFQWHPF